MIRLAALFCLVALPCLAQAPGPENTAAAKVLSAAESQCKEIASEGGPKPHLIFEPGAFTWLDLDGQFEANDLILDFNHIFCSAAYSLWAGSGGAMVSVVLNGETVKTWSSSGWRRVQFNGVSILLIAQHGSYCDSYGARACVLAVAVDDEALSVVSGTEGSVISWD